MDTIGERPVTVDEISLQLLDALDRLERLDRRFQGRSPVCTRYATAASTEVRA
jgi:hypothetical protein